MSAKLYTAPSGKDISIHSFSSGQLFKSCNYKYFLTKVRGFRRRDNSAALKFGRALESGVQFLHENGLRVDDACTEFKRLWLADKENTEIKFSKAEGSWANLYKVGDQLIKLYAILLPSLPIKDPVWQVQYKRMVFPGTHLDGLEDQGWVDIVSKCDWNHPMLPRAERPKGSLYRTLVIDMKTAGKKLDTTNEMLRLDPQLLRYSSLSGISDLAFLWMVKSIADAYKAGVGFTVLEVSGKWTVGEEGVVFEYDDETQTITGCGWDSYDVLKEQLSEIKGKGSTEAKKILIEKWLVDGILKTINIEFVTKQTIQFKAVRVHPEDIQEAGQSAAKEIADIHNCSETGYWPRNTGVRFPNTQCSWCECRGVCLREPRLVEELLVQITNPANDEWLDGVGEEEE